MSVDKFGMMADAPSTNIVHPIYKYSANLDDLENVEGFNVNGIQDQMYAFKLTDDGLYKREPIVEQAGGFNIEHPDIENRRMHLVRNGRDNKWYGLPSKTDWKIDIKMASDKVLTKGDGHVIQKIINSGSVIGSLVPDKNFRELTLLKLKDEKYYISSNKGKIILSFKTEFSLDMNFLKLSPGTTLLIDGFIVGETPDYKDFINGLQIKWGTKNKEFRVIIRNVANQYRITTSPSEVDDRLDSTKLNFADLFIWENYYINRIRLTTSTLVNGEIEIS